MNTEQREEEKTDVKRMERETVRRNKWERGREGRKEKRMGRETERRKKGRN